MAHLLAADDGVPNRPAAGVIIPGNALEFKGNNRGERKMRKGVIPLTPFPRARQAGGETPMIGSVKIR
jgi:hypothetical protein